MVLRDSAGTSPNATSSCCKTLTSLQSSPGWIARVIPTGATSVGIGRERSVARQHSSEEPVLRERWQ